jgi:hypothetical protein
MSRDGFVAQSTLEELFEPGTKDVPLARIYRALRMTEDLLPAR